MASLTETAYYSRKFITWGGIALVVIVCVRLAFGLLVAYINSRPKPLKPDNAFGPLPAIAFPQSASPSGELRFLLQTVSGTVPTASAAARVFIMPKQVPGLQSLETAQQFVKRLNFDGAQREISSNKYQWVDTSNPLRSIEMDVVNQQFLLRYFFPYDLTLFADKQIPSPQQAISEGINFIQSSGINVPDLAMTTPNVAYQKLVGNQLEPTTSQSQADAVKLDFFRNPYDGIPVVHNKPDEGNISIILSNSNQSEKRILEVRNNYWPLRIQPTGIGVYALKTSAEAWSELQGGKGYIARLASNEPTRAAITNVYLGYYDSVAPQDFIQPVYVFEGEKGFVAYVPAITSTWIRQVTPLNGVSTSPTVSQSP